MRNKLAIIGLIILATGAVCLWAENTYYGYIDEQGFLHESLFLPIGVLLIATGLCLLLAAGIRLAVKRLIH